MAPGSSLVIRGLASWLLLDPNNRKYVVFCLYNIQKSISISLHDIQLQEVPIIQQQSELFVGKSLPTTCLTALKETVIFRQFDENIIENCAHYLEVCAYYGPSGSRN